MRLVMSSSDYTLTTVSKFNLDCDRLYVFTLTRSSDTYNFYSSLFLSFSLPFAIIQDASWNIACNKTNYKFEFIITVYLYDVGINNAIMLHE